MGERYDENLLLGYIEGELDARGRAQVEKWLKDDPRLARLLAALSEDRESLRRLPDPPAPAWLMDEVDRQLERSMLMDEPAAATSASTIRKRHVLRRLLLGGSIAAMFAVVGGVVIYSLQPTRTMYEVAVMEERSPGPADPDRGIAAPAQESAAAKGSAAATPDRAAPPAMPAPALSSIADAPVAPRLPAATPPADAAKPAEQAAGAPAPTAPPPVSVAMKRAVPADETLVKTNGQRAAANAQGVNIRREAVDPLEPIVQMLRKRPAEARSLRLRIRTWDVVATTRQIAELSVPRRPSEARDLYAELATHAVAFGSRRPLVLVSRVATEPPSLTTNVAFQDAATELRGPIVPVPSTNATPAKALALRVSAGRLHEAVASLAKDAVNQRVELAPVDAAARRRLGTGDQGRWPSMTPDYRAILQPQVSLAVPEVKSAELDAVVEIPVVIEPAVIGAPSAPAATPIAAPPSPTPPKPVSPAAPAASPPVPVPAPAKPPVKPVD